MSSQLFINKIIAFAFPEQDAIVAGRVESLINEDLLYVKSLKIPDDMPESHFLLSLDFLGCNPDVVTIFENEDDFNIAYKLIQKEDEPKPKPKILKMVPKVKNNDAEDDGA